MSFDVLFVCTGNICRSAAAERLFATMAPSRWDARASSAGTGALVDHGIDGPTAWALGELGVDASGHRARRLEPTMVDAADLVLAATVEHRAAIVRGTPLAFRRVFTINEFARLAAGLPRLSDGDDEALRERVREVAAQRGLVEAPPEGADDIADPFGAPVEFARHTVALLAARTREIVTGLGLSD